MGTWTRAAVLRELPAVRVGPSLATSLRIQTVVAAVEKAAKDVRVVVTLTAQIRTAHEHCSGTLYLDIILLILLLHGHKSYTVPTGGI